METDMSSSMGVDSRVVKQQPANVVEAVNGRMMMSDSFNDGKITDEQAKKDAAIRVADAERLQTEGAQRQMEVEQRENEKAQDAEQSAKWSEHQAEMENRLKEQEVKLEEQRLEREQNEKVSLVCVCMYFGNRSKGNLDKCEVQISVLHGKCNIGQFHFVIYTV